MYDLTELGILNIADKEYDIFLNKDNVIGIGLGNKVINGIDTGEKVIKVLVEKKINKNKLTSYNLIPEEYKNRKTDVIEIGQQYIQSSQQLQPQTTFDDIVAQSTPPGSNLNRLRVRPLVYGYSISTNTTPSLTGTSSCLVCDRKGVYMLGGNFVMARENTKPLGTPIIQPGFDDYGDAKKDIVAYLTRYIPLIYEDDNPGVGNYVDCAIARLKYTPFILGRNIVNIGGVKGVIAPAVNMVIRKSGRDTGFTTGKIIAIGVTIRGIADESGRPVMFKDSFTTNPISTYQDYGSAFVDENNRIVGTQYAAFRASSVCSRMDRILDALKVNLVLS